MPHGELHNPLTAEDKAALDAAIQGCEEVRSLIARAAQAKIDVSELKSFLADSERKAKGIRAAFFPNG